MKTAEKSVIPAPASAGVNLSPQKRGAGIQFLVVPCFSRDAWISVVTGMTEKNAPVPILRFVSSWLVFRLMQNFS